MIRSFVVVVIAALFALTACKENPANSNGGTETPYAPGPKLVTEDVAPELVAANTAFAFDLYPQLLAAAPSENMFISPLSISMAFHMVYNGAESATKQAIADAFHIAEMPLDDLNYANAVLLSHLAYADSDVVSEIANSIWMRDRFEPSVKTDFVDRNRIAYLAEIATRDFDDETTVDEINGWVSDRTHKKIRTVLDPPIPADAMMYLINAIYFNGSWAEQFDKAKTTDRSFTLTSGAQKSIPTMYRHDHMDYLETEVFQAVRLPYGDGRFSAFVFLPKTGHTLDTFHASLNVENWVNWLGSFSPMQGTLRLPKFEFRYKTDLKPPLTQLGMGIAFSDMADFTGIADAALTISDARHMSYVRLDEEGTEAAAVTIIGVYATSIPQTFFMDVNRPFFFAIADSTTGSILFMGSVYDPAS